MAGRSKRSKDPKPPAASSDLELEATKRRAQLRSGLNELLETSLDPGVAGRITRRKILAVVERADATCVLVILPVLRRVTLTPREQEIVALALEGLANKSIARQLALKLPTVAAFLRHVYVKAGIHSREDLALELLLHWAREPSPEVLDTVQ